MNISQLMTRLKMDLGIYVVPLPFENSEKALNDVITTKTLPVFSQFVPRRWEEDLSINDLKQIDSTVDVSTYELPKHLFFTPIISIMRCEPINTMFNGAYYSGTPILSGTTDLFEDMLLGSATYDVMSAIAPPFSYDFIRPNKLRIYNMTCYLDKIRLIIGYQHADNLSTIPVDAEQSFYDLALLDMKIFLYNNLKYYDEINTAYGNIKLRIEDWSNAESQREDLLQKWSEVYHINWDSFIIA
nr:MAG TPA: hypothetical protein [Caudoviricetes sp.]